MWSFLSSFSGTGENFWDDVFVLISALAVSAFAILVTVFGAIHFSQKPEDRSSSTKTPFVILLCVFSGLVGGVFFYFRFVGLR